MTEFGESPQLHVTTSSRDNTSRSKTPSIYPSMPSLDWRPSISSAETEACPFSPAPASHGLARWLVLGPGKGRNESTRNWRRGEDGRNTVGWSEEFWDVYPCFVHLPTIQGFGCILSILVLYSLGCGQMVALAVAKWLRQEKCFWDQTISGHMEPHVRN